MAGRAVILALFHMVGVLGYKETVPLVAWSSKSSLGLDALSPNLQFDDSVNIAGRILSQDDICSFDTVLLVDQPGLHSSDLNALPASSALSAILKTVPSSKQYPHVKHSPSSSVQEMAESLTRRCGSAYTSASPAIGSLDLAEDSKHVVCVNMPAMEGSLKYRKMAMLGYDQYLSNEIAKIDAASKSHLVLYIGSPSEHSRRQFSPSSEFDATYAPPDNSTLSNGGIFQRYQLFTSPLLVALIVVFFIIVPIIMLAVSALASLPSSVRLDTPKGYNAQEKKAQ